MTVDEMTVGEMSVDEMPVDEMSLDEMSVDEMTLFVIFFNRKWLKCVFACRCILPKVTNTLLRV